MERAKLSTEQLVWFVCIQATQSTPNLYWQNYFPFLSVIFGFILIFKCSRPVRLVSWCNVNVAARQVSRCIVVHTYMHACIHTYIAFPITTVDPLLCDSGWLQSYRKNTQNYVGHIHNTVSKRATLRTAVRSTVEHRSVVLAIWCVVGRICSALPRISRINCCLYCIQRKSVIVDSSTSREAVVPGISRTQQGIAAG